MCAMAVLAVAAMIAGLCTPAAANSIVNAATATSMAGQASPPMLLAQTDLALPPVTADMLARPPEPQSGPLLPPLQTQAPLPAITGPVPEPTRIALMLPLRSPTFGLAAQAVRAGFLAAHEREKAGIEVTVIETGDVPGALVFDYATASDRHDIVVGPLSRSDLTAVVEGVTVSKPTIALTQPDVHEAGREGASAKLPPQLLPMGLSVEAEARQVAKWARASVPAGAALVLSTGSGWQRRAATAFVEQWQQSGREAKLVELAAFSGYLGAKSLADLQQQLELETPALLFAALDAVQAKQLRLAIGNRIPLYGTSQLNPNALMEEAPVRSVELDGARLVDLPWQLQPDHPAVMVYPRPAPDADPRRSADLERLYALGIDAFRVAREIALKRNSFELDGVTGKLSVRFGADTAHFERTETQAVYRDGRAVPVAR